MDAVIDWLMDGDPVIRWQTMRDLSRTPEAEWKAERLRTEAVGWGARFVEYLLPDGTWPDGRWTGTVWTLLTIMDCGLPAECVPIRDAAVKFLDRNLQPGDFLNEKRLLARMDLCHLAFWLRIGSYFEGNTARVAYLSTAILRAQMADGGWNCRVRTVPATRHSSFHTTFNVLEALSLAADVGIVATSDFRASEARALEFMLAHRMYRSDRTGDIVDVRFAHLAFPTHWHYTVLRGLDYMRRTPEICDPRLDEPISLIATRRDKKGRWPVEKRIPGTTLFDMETMGRASRWNTLRVLRVLEWRQAADA